MARARNIKPGFFSNEALAELPPIVRLLFIGLWTVADREGRVEDRPKRIKALVLPYDDCDIDALLTELSGKRDSDGRPAFIARYSAGGSNLIQVVNWHKHQNPHQHESPSTLPPLAEAVPPLAVAVTTNGGTSPADSLNLIPDSLDPPSPLKGGDAASRLERTRLFQEFWKAYPRKEAKGRAEKAWEKLRPSVPLVEAIMCGLERAKGSKAWQEEGGRYIPHPATWLNGRRWEDEELDTSSKPKDSAEDAESYAVARDLETLRQAKDRWNFSLENRIGEPEKYLQCQMALLRTSNPHPPPVEAAILDLAGFLKVASPC
jgi:hypothetical protein